MFNRNLFDWSLFFGVASWTYCSECGRRRPRDQQHAGLGLSFTCPSTLISICKRDKNHAFLHGCRYDSYRQRDLETNGVHSLTAVQSALDWRRAQRTLWGLDDDPQQYATMESYAQPQRQDWPVYDAVRGVYVEWTPATSHLESMLKLTVE